MIHHTYRLHFLGMTLGDQETSTQTMMSACFLPSLPLSYIYPLFSLQRPIVSHRRSPSPGPSRRPYDSYVPERFELPFRDNQPVYRPNNYRPGSSGWVSRSPSPDHYEHPARLSDSDYWERTPSWRGPPPMEEPINWPDRKSIPPSPSTSSARGRSQRDDAISMRSFEPSNSWKQTQADRLTRTDRCVASSFRYTIHLLTCPQISASLYLIVTMTAVEEAVSRGHRTG